MDPYYEVGPFQLRCSASVNEAENNFIHLAPHSFPEAKAPESTSSGKEMEVGLVGSSDPGATTSGLLGPASGLLGPADPAVASWSFTVPFCSSH